MNTKWRTIICILAIISALFHYCFARTRSLNHFLSHWCLDAWLRDCCQSSIIHTSCRALQIPHFNTLFAFSMNAEAKKNRSLAQNKVQREQCNPPVVVVLWYRFVRTEPSWHWLAALFTFFRFSGYELALIGHGSLGFHSLPLGSLATEWAALDTRARLPRNARITLCSRSARESRFGPHMTFSRFRKLCHLCGIIGAYTTHLIAAC